MGPESIATPAALPPRRHGGPHSLSVRPDPIRDRRQGVTGADAVQRQLIVHETRAETSEDEATSIQAVFGALVEDEHRIEQTCADVHDTVAAGRICPVLTQRTDHLEAIVARLRAPGDDALVLRGELSKKARVAVTDAMASGPEGTGIVLVATGPYPGEGFDWPELDTLFVGFPLAFRGRVVQYVGRLLRTHTSKGRVGLHDDVNTQDPGARPHARQAALRLLDPRLRRSQEATPSQPATTVEVSGGAGLAWLTKSPT